MLHVQAVFAIVRLCECGIVSEDARLSSRWLDYTRAVGYPVCMTCSFAALA